MGCRRISEDRLQVAEAGATLRGKDERLPGLDPGPKAHPRRQLLDVRCSWAPARGRVRGCSPGPDQRDGELGRM